MHTRGITRQGYLKQSTPIGRLDNFGGDDLISRLVKSTVASNPPVLIKTYKEFLTRLAYLSQGNPNLKILYRGQKQDYQCLDSDYFNIQNPKLNRQKSSLMPTLVREILDLATGELNDPVRVSIAGLGASVTLERFCDYYEVQSCNNLVYSSSTNQDVAFWYSDDELQQLAVLQHYEVIPTLMFDLTSDINTAMTFGYDETSNKCFIYVFGVPYRGEAISIFPEWNLATIDLRRILPPEALRPHFQSGFTITAHPNIYKKIGGLIHGHETSNGMMKIDDWDFSRYLLAKFELNKEFWQSDFVPKLRNLNFYYPDQEDLMFALANEIRKEVGLPLASARSVD